MLNLTLPLVTVTLISLLLFHTHFIAERRWVDIESTAILGQRSEEST